MKRALLVWAVLAGLLPAQEHLRLGLVGEAEIIGSRLRLTPALPQTVGAAWFLTRQPVAGGFEAVFRFEITEPGGLCRGADGFAFVLQNEGADAMAGRGSAGGFALGDGWRDLSKQGIARSIAVFFDTCQNRDGNDPSDNYVAICANGAVGKMQWPPRRLGFSTRLGFRLKDGKVHEARIRYQPPVMTVALDGGEPLLRKAVDVRTVVDAEGKAYVGFTASTGNGYENHDILGWRYEALAPQVDSQMFQVESSIRYALSGCMAGKNLCTPAKAQVTQAGEGRYHVVLPGHVERGTSIPNAEGRRARIENAQGWVCWDVAAANGCAAPAEALQVNTEQGRTHFWVRGPEGRSMAKSEGAFEFDVILK